MAKPKLKKIRKRKPRSQETKEKIRQALLERGRMVRLGYILPFRHSEKTKKLLRKLAKGRKPIKAIKASAEARTNRKFENDWEDKLDPNPKNILARKQARKEERANRKKTSA